ncbi:MAG: tetratricopeptide repeat protein [Desulfobaccales bacterium]
MARPCRSLLVLVTFWCLTGSGPAFAAALAGKLVAMEGEVQILSGAGGSWTPARPDQNLFVGDTIQTGPDSRAAILLVDESRIKLHANTILLLKQVVPSPRFGGVVPAGVETGESIYEVPRGQIWLHNKNERFKGRLETPAFTIAPRGTEFTIRVAPDGSGRVILLEGEVCLIHVEGEMCLRPGEEGVIIPGRAPSKRVLARPADAVQWVLSYSGIFSYRDLPLTAATETREPAAVSLSQGQADYDAGRLEAARTAAEAALRLQPSDPRALTLLGWIALQTQDPATAAALFRRVSPPTPMSLVGQALALFRQGDAAGAYRLLEAGAGRLPADARLTAMRGFFALTLGKPEEARERFQAAQGQSPALALPLAFLAQVELVQGHKEAARQAVQAALVRHPSSPMAHFTQGLVRLAFFDPEAGRADFSQALKLDPRFISAYVYLARTWLGGDDLDRAQRVISQALSLAPTEAEVLSLAGFIRLAFRDFDGARRYFEEAVRRDPSLGEPHIGLAHCEFRQRRLAEGVREMLTATLLEPRVALYQTQFGKALYQVRSFGKALETYDYAKTLDPKDPTPYLYKGIALSDLNRPGEAIQEINRSIALNDNVAMFRTRLALDRDLAVRNYNLARSYDQLGLRDWAFSKAITAVKRDPLSSSAHLFLSKSYATSTQGPYVTTLAQFAEDIKFRLLAPSNEASFESLRNDNYTPMFEMPYKRVLANVTVGTWREKNTVQDYYLQAYGGRPGLGGLVEGRFIEDNGIRDTNSRISQLSPLVNIKWDPSVKTSIQGQVQYSDVKGGDISFFNDYSYKNDPYLHFIQRFRYYDLGVVHRFSPRATLLAYYTYQRWDFFRLDFPLFPFNLYRIVNDREFHNFQLQQNLVWGKHNFIFGGSLFSGRNYAKQAAFLDGVTAFQTDARLPERSQGAYFFDYWRLHPRVLVELGLMYDNARISRAGFPTTRHVSQWSPVVGVNLQISPQHTLRLGLQRHMMTHGPWLALPLLPTETAGLPWMVFVESGTDLRQAGLSWEAEWGPRTFTALRLEALRFSVPGFNDATGQPQWQTWKTYRAAFTLNRILLPSLGLVTGVVGQRVVPDLNFTYSQFSAGVPFQDFSDLRGFLLLSWLHRSGWQAGMRVSVLQQWLKDRNDTLFGLVDLRLGKELAHKRGLVSLEVTNLFNRRFFYALEPTFFNQEFFPARQILFKLALYY